MGRIYEALGIEIQQNVGRCEQALIRGYQCKRRAVPGGYYCTLHTSKRAEAGVHHADALAEVRMARAMAQMQASADARVTRAMVTSSETEQGKPGAMRPEWYRKHPCEMQGCAERVTHGNTTPDVTIWYCQQHAADEIARNARNG